MTFYGRSYALGRLVAHENSASDLLGLLFEIDPGPLARLLELEDGRFTCHREVQAKAGRKGRLDIVVRRYGDGHPVAVLEMKGASDRHGDQLDRYSRWAEAVGAPAPKQFYCTLDGEGFTPPEPWQSLSLVKLFGAWRDSPDPHAAWLARDIAALLRTWDEEADGIIADATGWYVPDLVSRRAANAIAARLMGRDRDRSQAQAFRTSGGNPMFIAWPPSPAVPMPESGNGTRAKLGSASGKDLMLIDEAFAAHRRNAIIGSATESATEDAVMAAFLHAGLRAWITEDQSEPGTYTQDPPLTVHSRVPGLHARLRRTTNLERHEEDHWAFRGIATTKPRAAAVRLQVAITQAGIGSPRTDRRLFVVRTGPWPDGLKTREMLKQFESSGGVTPRTAQQRPGNTWRTLATLRICASTSGRLATVKAASPRHIPV